MGAASYGEGVPHPKPPKQAAGHGKREHCQELRGEGLRIYDSKNGLFVKEPERRYVKNGTELTSSVFFPVTKEARDALYSQILNSYEMVMEQQERQHPQQKDELEELLEEDDLPFEEPYQEAPLPTDEDAPVMSM